MKTFCFALSVFLLTYANVAAQLDEPVECELQSTDIMNVTKYNVVKVKGMTTKWARKNAVKSGVTTLFASNSVIDDSTDELIIPTGETIKLADDVFGAAGDALNLKSQFNQCSYGQLQFEPTTSNALVGTDGVYTVSLPSTIITGAADNPIAWAAVDKATAELGTLTSFADHVMVCMPPGTSGGWIAYAYINHWLSVYNNAWCGYPSGLLHELGHNLNLAHSSEGSTEYGDQSGLMGYSYGNDDGPIMCFNGPKTWQLGWFSEYHVDLRLQPGSAGLAI
ncbi:Gametolysin peptidase M11 [Fragilaria crotonensis]|nr:Gametolysin peptidase M11 [Fragilaria crotonensis]